MNLRFLKTIRGKLTLYFVTIFGVTLIIFSLVLYSIFAAQSRDDFDLVMTALATSVSESIKETGVNSDILDELKDLNRPGASTYSGYVEVLSSNETVMMKSPVLNNTTVPLSRELVIAALNGNRNFTSVYTGDPGGLWDNNGVRILYFPAFHKQHKYAVILIAPLSRLETMLSGLRLVIYTVIPVTLILSALAGWIFSRRAYAPVNELVNKANTITAEKLNSRLFVSDADDEIAHLASTLNSMIERLEDSFKTLKQFTSDASHELRTPLTILRGEIEVALKKPRRGDEYKMILQDSLEEVKRLQNIVESLLLLSQYENRKMTAPGSKVNLNELIIEAVSKSRFIASKKNISIVLKMDEDSPEEIFIKGDYQKLLNVFLNLFDNAVKYSNENSEIKCFLKIAPDAVVIITDEGIGISKDSIENIFERFYRADISRTRDENYSLGLGLSIVKAVVESHNGRIEVASILQKGTTFTIHFPLYS